MDAQVSCRDGSWSKVNTNWFIWARESDVARTEPPLKNPKETSLMIHPDASMKMYDINNIYIYIYIYISWRPLSKATRRLPFQ